MRETIIYILDYREKGEAGSVSLSIDFISHSVRREFNKILQAVFDLQKRYYEFNVNIELRKTLIENKEIEKLEFLENEIVQAHADMQAIGDTDFFERRFNLIKRILKDNGIKDGDKILTFEFWDECVSPDVLVDFLEAVIWKDLDKKKVQ